MADIHISRELLRAVARGEMPPRTLVELGLQHLTALCPHCAEEFRAFQRERRSGSRFDSAWKVLPAIVERHGPDLEDKQRAAARDLRTLIELPHSLRLAKVDRAYRRFRGTALAELLLAESKRHMPGNARESYELAETTEAVLRRTPAGPGVADLTARAMAYLGNAARRLDNYKEAKERFALARSIIRTEGVTDPVIIAEVDSAEAVLHLDQRRFRQAEELLTRSIALYSVAGAGEQAAHPLVTLGLLYYEEGDPQRAIEATRAALSRIHPERDLHLLVCAKFNVALFLCDAGRFDAAAEALLADRELFERFPDPYTRLRLVWLEGRITAGRGRLDAAERAYRETREGFIRHSWGYDAVMVSLDLALVYLRQGRVGEVKPLAEEMHRIFAADDVHRETVAALLLFEEAARREQVTVELVEDLADYLKRARANPGLRFGGKFLE